MYLIYRKIPGFIPNTLSGWKVFKAKGIPRLYETHYLAYGDAIMLNHWDRLWIHPKSMFQIREVCPNE